MTEEVHGVLLTDGRSRILLHRPARHSDGYGFDQRVDLVAGPFQGTITASSYEGPKTLRSFHHQLIALYQSLKGEVQLGYTYDRIKVSLKGDGLRHVTIRADACAGDYIEFQLSLSFSIDQTQLPAIITAVEEFFLPKSPPGQ